MTEQITPLFTATQPGPAKDEDVTPSLVEMARAVASICATRMLLMIAVITGSMIWGYTCFDPSRDRLYAAIAFSLVFVLPQTLLYFRRG
jgi:sterol desaturase/sphingolipid hydroxylase (fatty acid hydroxylase superfamily)